MAFREIHMVEIKEILLRLARGEAKKAVSRSLGVHRRTIKRYLKLAARLGVHPARDGVQAITDELIEKIRQEERPVSALPPGFAALLAYKPWIDEKLQENLKGSKILQLLRRSGVEVTDSTFYRFLREQCPLWIRHKITVRLPETEPGDYAQCDFGRLGKIYDQETGGMRVVYAFIVTLCFSRHLFVFVTQRQDSKAVIEGCEAAFRYFGGVPKRMIFDNPKPIVTRADRYEPKLHPSFLEYAQYRGFTVDPAVAGHPKGKPHVERSVPYVRHNFFAGETFVDLEDARRRAVHWCTHVAGKRIHGTTGQVPLEAFEKVERQHLGPFEDHRYDIPVWAECKVHPDHHIAFLKATYSVPTRYIGQSVTVRGDSALVKIFLRDKLIKLHARKKPGERSTDYDDYPKELTPYTLRDPQYQINKGLKKHPAIGAFIQALLTGPYPWNRLRSAQKVLRLCDRHGVEKVATACERFALYGVYDVKRLERMLKKQVPPPDPGARAPEPEPSQESLRFEREADSFNHYKTH